MSINRLIQRIRQTSKELQQARDEGDTEAIERLEDELYELEEELENEQQNEYDDNHQHGWY